MFTNETIKFADSVGSAMEYWGFRSIHGKIWTLIYLSNDPIDAGLIIDNLGVSKGLVSTAIKELLEYDLIVEENCGDNRSKFYSAKPHVMDVITGVLKKRESAMMSEVKSRFSELRKNAGPGVDPERIKNLQKIIKFGDFLLASVVKLQQIDLRPWRKI